MHASLCEILFRVARGMVTHTGFGGLLGEVKKVPSVTPRFVAFVSLILKLRLSLLSLPRAAPTQRFASRAGSLELP